MIEEETSEVERRETIHELFSLICIVQEVGRRLANETHGDTYSQVKQLNETLHQARIHMNKIKDDTVEGGKLPTSNLSYLSPRSQRN